MIAFAPEDDERLLVDSARAFARDALRPRLRAFEEAREVSPEVRRQFHELGLSGMDLPSGLGFGGLSLTARALVEEELAAGDLGAAVALDALGPAGEVLRRLPSAKQWLEPFLDDPLRRAALAWPGLRFVAGGARAQVVVTSDAVHTEVAAVEDRDVVGLAELPPAAVTLRSAGEPLGPDAAAWLRAALLRYAGVNAARAVGCARAAFEHARTYAEERTAFGKPIGHFQAIAFLLADMATEIDGARALTWRACRALDTGAPDAELRLAQARAQSQQMLEFVASSAVQILGGAGYVQDHPVEKWMRDARALAVQGFTAEDARALAMEAVQ
jgi:alkylation response protein AidB-like acyl-CoA dehydrogenase